MGIEILWYQKCSCGAITIETTAGTYSCRQSNFHKYFPSIDLRQHKRIRGAESYCCNHCVNGYGLDLCSCGSKEKVGHCDCGSKKPMQIYGLYERVVAENPWGRILNEYQTNV